MNNTKFLEEFNYFKQNPKEYNMLKSELDKNLNLGLAVVWLWVLLAGLIFHKNIPENLQGTFFVYTVTTIIVTGIVKAVFFIRKRRVNQFSYMFYKGPISDLFPDMSHPIVIDAKDEILRQIKKYNGISGMLAFTMYQAINDPETVEIVKNKHIEEEKLKKALDEANAIGT